MLAVKTQGYATGFKCSPKQMRWYQLKIKLRKDFVIEMSACQDVTAFIRSHCVKGDIIVVGHRCCVFVLLSQSTVTNTFY